MAGASRTFDQGLSMSGSDFIKLCHAVRGRMGRGRYRHSASVARVAEKLAVRHGASPLKARVAGVIHDIARLWKGEELIAYARAHGLPVSDAARNAPVLLHAPVAADIARREFRIGDPDVLGAIARHTVAVPGMTRLEQIVYLADTVEPGRTYEGRAELEAKAFESLDDAMLLAVKESLKYLMTRHVPIAQETVQLYNQMVHRNGNSA